MKNKFKALLTSITFASCLFLSVNTAGATDILYYKTSFPSKVLSSDYYNQEVDYELWDKFLAYDLCITDYDSMPEEQKELCEFIFETERSASGTVRCERARKILAGEDVGERVTAEEIDNGINISNEGEYYAYNYYEIDNYFYSYKYFVPDIIHLDNTPVFEYWLDDDGNEKILKCENLYAHFTKNEEFEKLTENLTESEKKSYLGQNVPHIEDTYISFLNDGNVLSCEFIDVNQKKDVETILKDDIRYAILSDNTAVVISNELKSTKLYKEEIVIPEKVDGHTVVAIESCAFMNANITKIVLPDTIKFIGYHAFLNCKFLESVNFPKNLEMIGTYAFAECTSLKNVEINCPKLVVKRMAFCDSGLEHLSVTAKRLDEEAFANNSVEDVVIGEGTENIEAYAFYNCNSLESVTLPKSLEYISNAAFGETGLDYIEIPEEIRIIGKLPIAKGTYMGIIEHKATDPLTDEPELIIGADKAICGTVGSEAEVYAEENNLKFISSDSVRLSKGKMTLETGQEKELKLLNSDDEIIWKSSDEKIAVVENGIVKGVSEGDAVITATKGEEIFSCNVTAVIAEEKPETLSGDANIDYQINVRDCAFIASALANGTADDLTEISDFNSDGKINVRDAAAIANVLA